MSATPSRRPAVEIRAEFDRAFAEPVAAARIAYDDLICVDAAGTALALRTADVRRILKCPPLTPVPSGASGLAGIGAVRGVLAGMYRLATLVGVASPGAAGANGGANAWAVLCGDGTVGLIFDAFAGYARARPEDLHRAAVGSAHPLTPQVVTAGGVNRLVVDVPALLNTIVNRTSRSAT